MDPRKIYATIKRMINFCIFEDPEVREGLKTYSNWPTFPQLYINGELIGGCDIALELYQSGELKKLIDSAVVSQKTDADT